AMGLVAAGFSGTWGYRRELRQSAAIIKTLTWASLMGGIIGATLLMSLPPTVFDYAAPILIVVAILFVVFQPRLNTWVRKRRQRGAGGNELMTTDISSGPTGPVTPVLFILIFLTGIYGGYFVAAQGVLLLGLLGVFLTAEKIVLSGKNKPTIKELKNANHNQPTDRLVGISLHEAGSPSVTLPIAISNTGKSIVIVQVIGTVVPIISLGKTIHAAKTNVPTQPPYIANLYQPVGTVCCVSPITPRVARSCYPCVLHVSATTGGITFSLIPNTLSIGE